MAYEFKLPDIGEGVVEGEIVKWLVNEGDEVVEDQPLVEVMTDKATVTIPSPKKGRVLKKFGAEGAIAKVHAPLIALELPGEGAAAAPAPAAAPVAAAPAAAPVSTPVAAPVAASAAAPAPKADVASKNEKVLATPVTRRIAREHGLDLSEVAGSGPQGRVLKKDVLSVVEGQRAPAAAPTGAFVAPAPVAPPAPFIPPPSPVAAPSDERMPIRGLRKAIFKKMTQSAQFAVPFTYVDEVDMTELVALRDRINGRLSKEGQKLTFLPFITKALIAALRKFPQMNALMDEEKQELIIRRQYNIGIGVATDAGLTVAVLHDADRQSLRGIGTELQRIGDAARDNKLTMNDLQGSTFTITSLGKDGGMFATPVINHPEVAILGIHRIEARPVVVDRQIVIRDRMYMSCSFDHRVIDGHVGAAFVAEIKRLLETPDLLLLELA
jgi:pyruvate dehydrogenase E2 component (dihydrolipoamide acetyltransferase)